ncbi:hypothetical protein BDZ97DRAFT_1792154, partial [Flammula alnicola]
MIRIPRGRQGSGTGYEEVPRYRRLIKDIRREHLKKRLPSYSVSTRIFPDLTCSFSVRTLISWDQYHRNHYATHPTTLPNAPKPIPSDETFFDLGGHSILATRLIFEIRKLFVVDAPLGLIFEQPTITGPVEAVDALRTGDLGLAYKAPAATPIDGLLTAPGATGFLGAFVLHNLLSRNGK